MVTVSKQSVSPIHDERISDYGRLVEAHRQLQRIFDRSLREKVGISSVWYEALLRLGRSPELHLPVNELGEALELTSGGATRLVDRLEEKGYVERTACPTDRRIWWVGLTDLGVETLNTATEIHLEDLEESFASKLTTSDTQSLKQILRRLRADPE